jgi:hypothetical protein
MDIIASNVILFGESLNFISIQVPFGSYECTQTPFSIRHIIV